MIPALELVTYCKQCDAYYMKEADYDDLRKRGCVLNRVIDYGYKKK